MNTTRQENPCEGAERAGHTSEGRAVWRRGSRLFWVAYDLPGLPRVTECKEGELRRHPGPENQEEPLRAAA